MDYTQLSNIVCRVESGSKSGTGFLINDEYVLTAFHVLNDLNMINLYFDSKEDPQKATYIDDNNDEYKKKDIALLRLTTKAGCKEYLSFLNRKLNPNEQWTTRAYPQIKGTKGNNFIGDDHIIQQHHNDLKNGKYDIELEHDQKFGSYKGVSGAPLIIDKLIAGVINSELIEQEISIELHALSTYHFQELLKKYNITTTTANTSVSNKEDIAGTNGWSDIIPIDKRNLAEKIKSVCSEIKQYRIAQYAREACNGKAELSIVNDRVVSSIKYRIFEVCQTELMNLVEGNEVINLSGKDIEAIIEKYTDKAEYIIKERSKDYHYSGISNRDTLRKIVLDLIDECYLAFDEEGIYV